MKTIFASEVTKKLGALISDIATATSRARERDGVVRRCAKAPRNVQNAARSAEMSAPIAEKTSCLVGNILLWVAKTFFINIVHQQCLKFWMSRHRTIFSAQWFGRRCCSGKDHSCHFFQWYFIQVTCLVITGNLYVFWTTHFFDQSEASKFVLLVIQNSEGICIFWTTKNIEYANKRNCAISSPGPCNHSDPAWLDFSICGLRLRIVLIWMGRDPWNVY